MKSTLAPQYRAQFADATKELGTVHKTSSLFNPSAKHDKCSAAVPLLTDKANLAFT